MAKKTEKKIKHPKRDPYPKLPIKDILLDDKLPKDVKVGTIKYQITEQKKKGTFRVKTFERVNAFGKNKNLRWKIRHNRIYTPYDFNSWKKQPMFKSKNNRPYASWDNGKTWRLYKPKPE